MASLMQNGLTEACATMTYSSDPSNNHTYYFLFLGQAPYNLYTHVLAPIVLLLICTVICLRLLYLHQLKIHRLRSPNTQDTYNIISVWLFRAIQVDLVICLICYAFRIVFISFDK